jgi:Rhodanese-like domain
MEDLNHLMPTPLKILIQAFGIAAFASAVSIGTNMSRADGIPLITDIPYDIFAPCKDSEASSEALQISDITSNAPATIYVDARPKKAYDKQHVKGAINVPYSALFGASEADINRIKSAVTDRNATAIVVYGLFLDPADAAKQIDFGKPLADQLIEAQVQNVGHVEGGLEALNKSGVEIVQGSEDVR